MWNILDFWNKFFCCMIIIFLFVLSSLIKRKCNHLLKYTTYSRQKIHPWNASVVLKTRLLAVHMKQRPWMKNMA